MDLRAFLLWLPGRAPVGARFGPAFCSAVWISLICGAALGAPPPAPLPAPLPLPLPDEAELLRRQDSGYAAMMLPTGPAKADLVPGRNVEGQIWRRSWRVLGDRSTLDVFAPLRSALTEAGFHVEYACRDRICGGFSFRFGIDMIPAPDMRVRLSDFEFLSASHRSHGTAIALLVSRTGGAVYVQAIERHPQDQAVPPLAIPPAALPPDALRPQGGSVPATEITSPETTSPETSGPALPTDPATVPAPPNSRAALKQVLQTQGHAVLAGLDFASGSAQLQDGSRQSLADLAAVLSQEPGWRVMIVGHTDNVGGLDGNIALSRRRAAAVRSTLERDFDLPRARLEVAGAGFLAPLTQNGTAAGRDINRRVEVVLLAP